MSLHQIILLAMIQGAAELLPVSSSAHVIVAEKLMGLDPSAPEMTFLLVMLHTGTMFAVLVYFWSRWKALDFQFLKMTLFAAAVTGCVGLVVKKFIEKVILEGIMGHPHAEIEHLFKSLPLISLALLSVGLLIFYTGTRKSKSGEKTLRKMTPQLSLRIGLVQALCLPFRGFSRSGATISAALLSGVERNLAEDFSFALAVWITPPVIVLELHRLLKANAISLSGGVSNELGALLLPGLLGMCFSFATGWFALKLLSSWLSSHRWKYFGIYCIIASAIVFCLA